MGAQPDPPPPPSGPEMPALEPIGPWPRLGAKFIDNLILLVPSMVLAIVVGGSGFLSGEFGPRPFLASVLTTLLSWAYFVYLEATRGQTLGKMALGFKVIDVDGRTPSLDVAAKRNLWMLLPLIPVIGSFAQLAAAIGIGVTIGSGPFHRGLHDNFAGGTAVVRSR
ncbi:MAG: RDD family protein [Acidimicrobiales bacterium]|nr:RDD family protein [Acidimicrobiales bacterium]